MLDDRTLYEQQSLFSKEILTSPHIEDLSFAAKFISIVILFLITVGGLLSVCQDSLLSWIGTVLMIWAGAIGYLIGLINERAGTITFFKHEIISLCRIIVSVDMMNQYIELYKQQKPLTPGGFASSAGQEQYFEHFHAMGPQISRLNNREVARISDFFNYTKGARDATRLFDKWKNSDGSDNTNYTNDQRKNDVFYVLSLLFLMLESAYYAVKGLSRTEHEFEFFMNLVAHSIVSGYNFLEPRVPAGNIRRCLVEMRGRKDLIDHLRKIDKLTQSQD